MFVSLPNNDGVELTLACNLWGVALLNSYLLSQLMCEIDRKRARLTTIGIRVGVSSPETQLPTRDDGPRSGDRPIDRLCHELLLGWDVSQHLLQSNVSNLELSTDDINSVTAEMVSVLPSTHRSYSDYVDCWVPAMLQELKGCIASKISQSACFSARGYLKGFVSETSFQSPQHHHHHQTTPAHTITFSANCLTVEEYQSYRSALHLPSNAVSANTGSHRGTDRSQLQLRDLVLISTEPLTHPREGDSRQQQLSAGSKELFGQCATVVGIVKSHRFVGGLRTMDIAVSSSGWIRLVEAMGDW